MNHELDDKKIFKRIFYDSPAASAIIGRGYQFLTASKIFCRIFGYTKNELKNITFWDIMSADDAVMVKRSLKKIFAGKVPYLDNEYRGIKKK